MGETPLAHLHGIDEFVELMVLVETLVDLESHFRQGRHLEEILLLHQVVGQLPTGNVFGLLQDPPEHLFRLESVKAFFGEAGLRTS